MLSVCCVSSCVPNKSRDAYKHAAFEKSLDVDVDPWKRNRLCVYNIPGSRATFPWILLGQDESPLWPNICVTAGVEAPISPVSLMFTDRGGGGGAHLDKHLRVQSNATPNTGKCLDTAQTSVCVCVCGVCSGLSSKEIPPPHGFNQESVWSLSSGGRGGGQLQRTADCRFVISLF